MVKSVKSKVQSGPYLSLCVMFRDNAVTMPKLLESIKGHFDEVILQDTGSVDGTRQLAEKFLKTTRGKLVNFKWCDDFAKARQNNFEAASGKWKMFLDSDDVLVGGERLRWLCQSVDEKAPQVNGIYLRYDYDRNEELDQMRLVRSSAGWTWSDAIHERMVTDQVAQFGNFYKKDVHVWHKRKSEAEKNAALKRNAIIAHRDYETTTDKGYKARLARTIAMELKMIGKPDLAVPYLKEVLAGYPELPEGRQSAADLSRIASYSGNLDEALEWARIAGPSYESLVKHAKQDYAGCIAAQTKASALGPQVTHEGFIFEKAYAPICMADAALQLGKRPEQIEKVLNSVRADYRIHDPVAPAVARMRHMIDRITILVPGTPQPFDSDSTNAMLGGSEEAVVYLARALAKQGRNVRVYGVLPPLSIPGVDRFGIDWQPFEDFRIHNELGTLVTWRATGVLHDIASTSTDLISRHRKGDETAIPPTGLMSSSLWLHDMSLGINAPAKTKTALLEAVDSVVVLSDHHQRCIEQELVPGHSVKFSKLSNGIVREDFEKLDWSKRDPNRIIYSSCPSRGLSVLLKAWPTIKAACPDAYLDIYYDWSMLERNQRDVFDRVMADYKAVQHLNVKHHGGVGHQELHEALAGANVWAYSHYESTDVETFAISAIKATAAGAEVITAPNGALPEVAPDASFISDPNQYASAVISAIKDPESDQIRRDLARKVLDRFDWDAVAARFSQIWSFTNRLRVTTDPVCSATTQSSTSSITEPLSNTPGS